MNGFIRISEYLLKRLKPNELNLYYAIEHFNVSRAHCYASQTTIMRLSGIRTLRTYKTALKKLLDSGLIVSHGKRKEWRGCCVFESLHHVTNNGFPVLKSYLFNPEIKASDKVVAIAHLMKPKASAEELSKCLKVSLSTIKHSSKFAEKEVRPIFETVQKKHSPECKKSIVRKDLEQDNNKTTLEYFNLLGEKTAVPENTNPVVFLFAQEEAERQAKEKEDLIIQTTAKDLSLDILEEYPDYKLLIEDLERLYPKVAEKILIQAAHETIKKSKIIQGTRLQYAQGIIKKHFAGFPNHKEIKTVISAEIILSRLKQESQAKKDRIKQSIIAKKEDERASAIEEKNKDFFDGLSEAEKEKLQPVIEQLGNPAGVPFLTPRMKYFGAIANTDFIKYSLECLGGSAVDEGGIRGSHPLQTATPLLVAS